MNPNYCLSILALNEKYQTLTQQLIQSLQNHSPDIPVVIGTDNPNAFEGYNNVLAFPLKKRGILHCYHDKRFVIEKALTEFPVVVQIDADTKITGCLPQSIDGAVGLGAIHTANLVEHVRKYNPERLKYLYKLAHKLDLSLENVTYIGEALFSVSGEDKCTEEFLRQWDRLARYLELHGVHAGQGNAMGLAAAKAGLTINKPLDLEAINRVRYHTDASHSKAKQTFSQKWAKRVDYHFRLNKARMQALKDFPFFYL